MQPRSPRQSERTHRHARAKAWKDIGRITRETEVRAGNVLRRKARPAVHSKGPSQTEPAQSCRTAAVGSCPAPPLRPKMPYRKLKQGPVPRASGSPDHSTLGQRRQEKVTRSPMRARKSHGFDQDPSRAFRAGRATGTQLRRPPEAQGAPQPSSICDLQKRSQPCRERGRSAYNSGLLSFWASSNARQHSEQYRPEGNPGRTAFLGQGRIRCSNTEMPIHEPRDPEADSSAFLPINFTLQTGPGTLTRSGGAHRRKGARSVGESDHRCNRHAEKNSPSRPNHATGVAKPPTSPGAGERRVFPIPHCAGSCCIFGRRAAFRLQWAETQASRARSSHPEFPFDPPRNGFAGRYGFQSLCRSTVGKTGDCGSGLELRPRSGAVQGGAMSRQCVRANHPERPREDHLFRGPIKTSGSGTCRTPANRYPRAPGPMQPHAPSPQRYPSLKPRRWLPAIALDTRNPQRRHP